MAFSFGYIEDPIYVDSFQKYEYGTLNVSEIWRGMPGQKSVPSFENGKCVFEVPVEIEDFINQFSVTYGKGSFILKGSFLGRSNYHLRTSVGTDMGICASINPVVSLGQFTLKCKLQFSLDNIFYKMSTSKLLKPIFAH